MKQASSPRGLFIKKQEETLINSVPVSWATYHECIYETKGRLWNFTVHHFNAKWKSWGKYWNDSTILHIYTNVIVINTVVFDNRLCGLIDADSSTLFIIIVSITVPFAVFSFQHVAPIRIPRTRTNEAKNILYMCQLTGLCSVYGTRTSNATYLLLLFHHCLYSPKRNITCPKIASLSQYMENFYSLRIFYLADLMAGNEFSWA